MALVHLVEIDTATRAICGEWIGESATAPASKVGRSFVDVTSKAQPLGAFSAQTYDGRDFSSKAPRILSPLDFARLFTQAERIAVRTRQETNDTVARVVGDFYALVQLAGSVNLDHPDVAAALSYMVVNDLLTSDRRAAILRGEAPT